MSKVKLKDGLIKHTVVVVSLLTIIFLIITIAYGSEVANKNMKHEAQSLNIAANAVWDYITLNQDRIEYNSKGEYEYKGIHCAIAGVTVAQYITLDTDNTIRFVSYPARNAANRMDDLEKEVMEDIKQKDLEEVGLRDEMNGRRLYRYFTPIYVEESCLECHGEPAGEIDKSGYEKEGYKIGDIIGLTSVSINAKTYEKDLLVSVIISLLIFGILLALFIVIIYNYLNKYVTLPISKLEKASSKLSNGDYEVELPTFEDNNEISSLAEQFGIMAKKLEDSYNNLEGQVESRTEELSKAYDEIKKQQVMLENVVERLKEESNYKSEFLAIMSHELKTPLSSVVAFTEILLEDNVDEEQRKNLLKEIQLSSEVLQRLIRNILDMAKIETGKIKLEYTTGDWVDVVGIVSRVVAPIAERKGIKYEKYISSDVPLMVADWEQIRHAIENIVGNAIKFTNEGGKISLNVTYDKGKNSVIVKVIDNGIGIDEQHLPFIFEKFMQCDSSLKRQRGGSGLGLALAKNIVELHNGTIEVESKVGEGSCFTIIIPVTPIKGGSDI